MPLPIKEEDLEHITKKVYALYAKHGVDGISMDEVSRQINISKATLYRYFTSKEDIVKGMTNFMISHLNSVQFTAVKDIQDVIGSIKAFYIKSVLIAALSGTQFVPDLKNKFPDTYKASYTAMAAMHERFAAFYEQSVEKGFFRDLPFALVSCQFGNMIPVIIDMDHLEQNKMELQGTIREYYRMFLCQVLKGEYLYVTDREETYDFVPGLADILEDEFFIDSIRR